MDNQQDGTNSYADIKEYEADLYIWFCLVAYSVSPSCLALWHASAIFITNAYCQTLSISLRFGGFAFSFTSFCLHGYAYNEDAPQSMYAEVWSARHRQRWRWHHQAQPWRHRRLFPNGSQPPYEGDAPHQMSFFLYSYIKSETIRDKNSRLGMHRLFCILGRHAFCRNLINTIRNAYTNFSDAL